MREIMFRGKRMDNGEWVEGWYQPETTIKHWNGIQETVGVTIAYKVEGGFLEDTLVDPATVGQYTGLKDKNGNRIFEGDIVRATIERAERCQSPRIENGVIGYDCIGMIGLILYKAKNGENVWSDFFNELSLSGMIEDYYFEVIGNIHDNQEMLKGGEG